MFVLQISDSFVKPENRSIIFQLLCKCKIEQNCKQLCDNDKLFWVYIVRVSHKDVFSGLSSSLILPLHMVALLTSCIF